MEEKIIGYGKGLEGKKEFALGEEDLQDIDEKAMVDTDIYDVFKHEHTLDYVIHKHEKTSEKFPNVIFYLAATNNGHPGEIIFDRGGAKDKIRQRIKERYDSDWRTKETETGWNNMLLSDIDSVESNIKRIASGDLDKDRYYGSISFWDIKPEMSEAYIDTITKEGDKVLDKTIIHFLEEMIKRSQKYEKLAYDNKEGGNSEYIENRIYINSIQSQTHMPQLTEEEEELVEPIKRYGDSLK